MTCPHVGVSLNTPVSTGDEPPDTERHEFRQNSNVAGIVLADVEPLCRSTFCMRRGVFPLSHLAQIEREHVLQALKLIRAERVKIHPPTLYELLFEGHRYPPKDAIRYGAEMAGQPVDEWVLHGGAMVNNRLIQLGFTIVLKHTDLCIPLGYRNSQSRSGGR